jgi:hypothetical protein
MIDIFSQNEDTGLSQTGQAFEIMLRLFSFQAILISEFPT